MSSVGMPYYISSKSTVAAEPSSDSSVTLAAKIGYVYLAPFLLTSGILGSLANLATLSHRKFSGSRFFTYLKALAVADLCFLCFAVSSIIHTVAEVGRVGSEKYLQMVYQAHLEEGLTNTFLAASVFLIVCVTLDRFYAICRPTFYLRYRSRDPSFAHKATVEVFLAFFFGFALNVPRFFFHRVEVAYCVWEDRMSVSDSNGNNSSSNNIYSNSGNDTTVCKCGDMEYEEEVICSYGQEENVKMTSTLMWKTYVVLSELAIRVFPCILLVCLNLAMIRDFNLAIRRRRMLMAGVFAISSLTLLGEINEEEKEENNQNNNNNKHKERKGSLHYLHTLQELFEKSKDSKTPTVEIVDIRPMWEDIDTNDNNSSNNNNNNTKPSVSADITTLSCKQLQLRQKRPSVFVPPDLSGIVTKLQNNRDARRKSLTMSGKEKNVIVTLTVVSVAFVVCNLPQSILRLMLTFGDREGETLFEIFRVLANLLEILNCASNFYLYCLVNKEIRSQVREMWMNLWEKKRWRCSKSTMEEVEDSDEEEEESGVSRESRKVFKEVFPEIFCRKKDCKGQKSVVL